MYSPYPDALLYMRYIIAVGKMILRPLNDFEDKTGESPKFIQTENDKEIILNIDNSNRVQTAHLPDTPISEAFKVHDLSPTLWHSVDLFICLTEKNINGLIHDASIGLIECSLRMNDEHWFVSPYTEEFV